MILRTSDNSMPVEPFEKSQSVIMAPEDARIVKPLPHSSVLTPSMVKLVLCPMTIPVPQLTAETPSILVLAHPYRARPVPTCWNGPPVKKVFSHSIARTCGYSEQSTNAD